MAYDKFLIAPFDSGLVNNLPVWQTPEDSFQKLDNAYVWRGRIKKRFGSRYIGGTALNSRFRINLGPISPAATYVVGTTNGAGAFTGIVPNLAGYRVGQTFVVGAVTFTINALGNPNNMTDSSGIVPTHTMDTTTGELIFVGAAATTDIVYHPYTTCVGTTNGFGDATGWVPGLTWKIGQQFSIGTEIFTVYQNGIMYSSTGVATTHTFNTGTGIYNFVAAAINTPIYFYPSEPVMGLDNWENGPVNNHPSIGFDTQFCYMFAGNAWSPFGLSSPTWHGNNSDFFWLTNWLDLSLTTPYLFVSNFNAHVPAVATDDPMYYYDSTTWHVFRPIFTASGRFVRSAKIILPFKDHMILLNTIENDGSAGLGVNVAHPNRCRYSINGNPLKVYAAPPDVDSWREIDEVGYGGAGWIDAATDEAIIGAEFIKDRLIVYFERSTWELVYTNSPKPPFVWQKLNSELGTQSTYSTVIFDKVVLSVGNTGIHACNGMNVERVDDKIPNDVFNVRTSSEGVKRIAGIRDYQTELVYWSWPEFQQDVYADVYPKKILVYNYNNGTWAYNDDVITSWGYFEQQTGLTWADITWPWSAWVNSWGSGVLQAQSKRIIAGNQQGFVFIVDPDLPQNECVMQVTNATYAGNLLTLTIVDHTLEIGDFINIPDLNGITISGTEIYKVVTVSGANVVQVDITGLVISGTYVGGGTASRVSRIDIISKQWNPYSSESSNFNLAKIDFCVVSTTDGAITVDYAPGSADLSMIDAGNASGSILGTSVLETSPYGLYPLEALQVLLWHPLYFQTQSNGITIRLAFTDAQMISPSIVYSGFELQGILLHTKKTGRLE